MDNDNKSKWQGFPYIFRTDLFHAYIPGTPVRIFHRDRPAVVKSFKRWEGIISNCVSLALSSGKPNNYASVAIFNKMFDPILVDVWVDMNPTIQCEPLFEAIAFHKSLCPEVYA